ncbi:hypothetical protein PSN45_002478 [Yamadazyma tenuis]|uniref:Shugoshin C-terminal domain-containing protein n=1 Tax=Candida tenuis (strain ATCC 10573 / BCRC 21748 / CBS 615 / JCM 9827 / NBRC 10315 / NRRL Y-1498 / VKM Y-70) TaxID=590646 RepID=G3B0C0_CANTC|nr:uncharacterized protein CANTEDRAFT_113086 [Yamadazyma tenuis ATCC 10573]EGV65365.1 hypothetical protein CANTEDRAFT_113086 [Yamadazyma tenuis ATCC 10573]WEJ94974.1 hypothetical protein PSN45_002478 [Yamadazyma tenuis]
MARPSSSSLSFVHLAQEKTREKERENSFQATTEKEDINTEKYVLQNKTLTRNNEIMTTKLLQMEKRVADLINENVSLRANKTELDVKLQLEAKLDLLESALTEKINDIYHCIQTFREREGLSTHKRPRLGEVAEEPAKSTVRLRRYSLGPGPRRRSIGRPIKIFEDVTPEVEKEAEDRVEITEALPQEDKENRTPPATSESDMSSPSPTVNRKRVPQKLNFESAKRHTMSSLEEPTVKAASQEPVSRITKSGRSRMSMPFLSQEVPKRSSRHRKPVDYKEPSLGKKMRRESAHFVDAVTDDYYTCVKKEKHRTPMSRVDSNKPNLPHKVQSKKNDDISVDDFTDGAKRTSRRYTINN